MDSGARRILECRPLKSIRRARAGCGIHAASLEAARRSAIGVFFDAPPAKLLHTFILT
jgi:hypothetical protein